MVDNPLPVNLSTFVSKLVVTSLAFAFKSNAVWVAVLIGFNKSVVLFTFPNPTIELVIPLTVPVNVGLASGALKFNADWVAVLMGLFASLVLFTFPNPTIELVIPLTVPVNAGLARFAFNANALVTSVEIWSTFIFVAYALKSWSPVLVPEIAASFVFSAVV